MAPEFDQGVPMTLAKYNLGATKTLDFSEGRFLKVCWPAHVRDVEEALRIRPANFGDVVIGIDDLLRVMFR